MKTQNGYETNGTYLKFKSGFTGLWNVETETEINLFNTEIEADNYIKKLNDYENTKRPKTAIISKFNECTNKKNEKTFKKVINFNNDSNDNL